MQKTMIVKAAVLFAFAAGIFSCTSLGLSGSRVEVSPFADVKPPYIFMVKSIGIINKDGFPTGENFIDDFLISTGYKYNFHFVFPETLKKVQEVEKNEAVKTTENKTAPYNLDLIIKEKSFTEDLKELTSISGILHIYGKNNMLLYQVVLTEESTVSINSYYKLYQVVDRIFDKLHKDLGQKQKEREKAELAEKLKEKQAKNHSSEDTGQREPDKK